MPVKLIAAREHNGYEYNGERFTHVNHGDPFTVEDEARAARLVEKGLAHRDEEIGAPAASGDVAKPIPVVKPIGKVDGRTKAGRAGKRGR